ncbi:MAG: hypothetical protein LBJ67_01845 [Planctomycetaceae bacterium]|nr:hypothetical protein [Planctomycetaceae bacterium]
MQIGELPVPHEGRFTVQWQDLNEQSVQIKLEIARGHAELISQYLANNLDNMIAPDDFLQSFLHMTEKEAKGIIAKAQKHQAENITKDEDEKENDEQVENTIVFNAEDDNE